MLQNLGLHEGIVKKGKLGTEALELYFSRIDRGDRVESQETLEK